ASVRDHQRALRAGERSRKGQSTLERAVPRVFRRSRRPGDRVAVLHAVRRGVLGQCRSARRQACVRGGQGLPQGPKARPRGVRSRSARKTAVVGVCFGAVAIPTHHVLLIPGFFGFGRFGELSYFSGVREAIESSFERLGLPVTVTEVPTLPMSSIRFRAARVLETLAEVASRADGPIHLIGHSTGGLDARLAIAPTASLPANVVFDAYDRVKTLVTVCAPHYGTPVATYFTRPMGRFLIRTVGSYLIFMLERGRVPLKLLLRLGYFFVRARDPFRKRPGTFDDLYDKLLSDLSEPRILELATFLKAVVKDQSLLFQLTPAGCDLLNACTADPKLAYASVV